MEAAAGEAIVSGGLTGMSWGEYGIAGLVICGFFWALCKFVEMWSNASQKREDGDRETRKSMYASFNSLADALNRNSAAIEKNAAAAEKYADAVTRMISMVGNLPCSMRDSALRTRVSD